MVYTLPFERHAGAVMTKNSIPAKAAIAILFSLTMACLLGFGGLLAGMYLWHRFGPPAKDFDETDALLGRANRDIE